MADKKRTLAEKLGLNAVLEAPSPDENPQPIQKRTSNVSDYMAMDAPMKKKAMPKRPVNKAPGVSRPIGGTR